jgi:hypothetical protein
VQSLALDHLIKVLNFVIHFVDQVSV